MSPDALKIREARPEDAAAVIALREQLSAETQFVLNEPGESVLTSEQFAARIAELAKTENGVMFVAEKGGCLVGLIFGNRGHARKIRHTLTLALGVIKAHWGCGAGRSLLGAVATWAGGRNIHRLELTVHSGNDRAIALYDKMGYVREGTKRHSLKIDGEYADEWLMSKLLPE